jgi:hypothetical protein
MFSSRDAFENDFCPVKDDLLGEMYRASEHGLPQLVASVSPDVRAMLALFAGAIFIRWRWPLPQAAANRNWFRSAAGSVRRFTDCPANRRRGRRRFLWAAASRSRSPPSHSRR